MSFAAIHIAEFPVIVWQRACAELRSAPLGIVEGVPPQQTVVSLNERAKALGVEHGMSKVQAEAAGTIHFHTRQIDEERRAFAEAIRIAERFSPRIEAIASPGNAYAANKHLSASLLLDSSGTGTLFGSIENYAHRLHKELKAAGFPAGISAAPNAEAALLLARSSRSVTCAHSADLRAKLAPLPVSLLACELKTLDVLSRWGICSLGQLASLPETALISRLGQPGRRLQQLARGEAEHLLVPEEPVFTLSETTVLDSPLELLDPLLFVLSLLLDTILRKAAGRACALRVARVTLRLERDEPHTLTVRPATPTQNQGLLLKLIHLELQAHPPRSGILTVTLEAEPAAPQTAQRGLFQAQFPQPDKLDLLLGRLRVIAGEENVGSPQLLNSSRHDAFTMAPFQPSLYAPPETGILPTQLALRIFRPPQPARVVLSSGQPRTLFWQGTCFVVTSAAGPWHSSGSWWSPETWDVDCWDVVTAEPLQALRLQQEHASKSWTVVGLYD